MNQKMYEIYVDSEFYAREENRSRAVAIYHCLDDDITEEADGKKKQLMEVWDTDKNGYPGRILKEDIIHCPQREDQEEEIDDELDAEIEQQHTRHRGIHI